MKTDFIIHEPSAVYHEQSRTGKYLSSHLLADFRESPALYHKKVTGEIEDKDSSAFVIGRAAHCLILEGRKAFDRDYVVSDGPINPRTGEAYGRTTKAFAEWAATQEREIISGKDFSFLLNRVGTAGGRHRGRCGSGRVLFRSLSDPDGLVQSGTRSGRSQDLRQPEVVRVRLPPLRIHLPAGVLPGDSPDCVR